MMFHVFVVGTYLRDSKFQTVSGQLNGCDLLSAPITSFGRTCLRMPTLHFRIESNKENLSPAATRVLMEVNGQSVVCANLSNAYFAQSNVQLRRTGTVRVATHRVGGQWRGVWVHVKDIFTGPSYLVDSVKLIIFDQRRCIQKMYFEWPLWRMAGCVRTCLRSSKSLLMKSIIRRFGSWHGDCSYEVKQENQEEADKMNERTKILVVDDEEVVRLSLVRTLSGEHCNVAVVRNGKDALQMMEQQKFDVVLLDLRMPGMSGMAVLKTIKERWPESEVIIITGYPAVDSAKEAVTLGAYDYLAKPVGPDDVINAANGAMLHKRWALRSDQPVGRAGMQ